MNDTNYSPALRLVVSNPSAQTATAGTSPDNSEWPATERDIPRFIDGETVLYYRNPLGISTCSMRLKGPQEVEIVSGDGVVLHTLTFEGDETAFFRELANLDPDATP